MRFICLYSTLPSLAQQFIVTLCDDHATDADEDELVGYIKAVDGDESSYWRSDPGSDAVQARLAGLLWGTCRRTKLRCAGIDN